MVVFMHHPDAHLQWPCAGFIVCFGQPLAVGFDVAHAGSEQFDNVASFEFWSVRGGDVGVGLNDAAYREQPLRSEEAEGSVARRGERIVVVECFERSADVVA